MSGPSTEPLSREKRSRFAGTVSLIVPSYCSLQTLPETLQSLTSLQGTRVREIILVDSSPDDTACQMIQRFPQVRVITLTERTWPAAARNIGARAATADYLGFVDADVRVAEDWLEKLLFALETNEAPLAGGAVANANPESTVSRILYWIEFSEFLPGGRRGFRPFLSSSNLLMSRLDFLAAGGFDENFRMAEDLALTMKWQGRSYFEPSARVYHRQRTEWRQVLSHLRELGYWSGVLRRCFRLTGSGLRKFPLLSFTLPLLRAPRILLRLWKADLREFAGAILLLPGLLAGLFTWSAGFYRGLRSSSPPAP